MKSEYKVNGQLIFSFDGNAPITGTTGDFSQLLIRKVKISRMGIDGIFYRYCWPASKRNVEVAEGVH